MKYVDTIACTTHEEGVLCVLCFHTVRECLGILIHTTTGHSALTVDRWAVAPDRHPNTNSPIFLGYNF